MCPEIWCMSKKHANVMTPCPTRILKSSYLNIDLLLLGLLTILYVLAIQENSRLFKQDGIKAFVFHEDPAGRCHSASGGGGGRGDQHQ